MDDADVASVPHFVVVLRGDIGNRLKVTKRMDHDELTYDTIFDLVAELLSQLAIGDEFHWRQLLGEDRWSQIIAGKRAQTVGYQLSRHFSRGPHPVITCVRISRSPRRSIFRKIRKFKARG